MIGGSSPGKSWEFFSSPPQPERLWHPTRPPIQGVPGALSLGVKRSWYEAHHSPPPSAQIKEWVELYLHSPNTSSWRGAQLKAQGQLYLYLFILVIKERLLILGSNLSYENQKFVQYGYTPISYICEFVCVCVYIYMTINIQPFLYIFIATYLRISFLLSSLVTTHTSWLLSAVTCRTMVTPLCISSHHMLVSESLDPAPSVAHRTYGSIQRKC
jgi:hypothetical protein